MTAAAIVPPERAESRAHRIRPIAWTAAAVAVAGAVAVGSTGQASDRIQVPGPQNPAVTAGFSQTDDGTGIVAPAGLTRVTLR
jgi:hypothetical protein